MPLKSGKSERTIQSNIRKVLKDNKGDKKIGNTKKDMSKAAKVKQAVAVALSKADYKGKGKFSILKKQR